MSAVFFANRETRKLEAVAYEIAKLADFEWRNKAGSDKVVFKKIGNPLGVTRIGFLTGDSLDVFGMGKQDTTGRFQDVIDRDPILSSRFHTNIMAMVKGKPVGKKAEVLGKSRKAAGLVGSNALVVSRSNTGDDKGFVDINAAANGMDDTKGHNRLLLIEK